MNIRTKIASIITAVFLFCSTQAGAANSINASGEASEDMTEAAVHLASATANFSAAGIYLSGDTAIVMGKAVPRALVSAAEISGDSITFSAEVLAEGMVSTAQLSADLTTAGIDFSMDIPQFVATAAIAGINISEDTARIVLSQAVNIAAQSGRLSGDAALLALSLTAAGVELSVDTTELIARGAAAGIEVSEEAAENLIKASLAIGAECIEKAVIAERYVVMTLSEANQLLKETSMEVVRSSLLQGKRVYSFSLESAAHLRSLGIDATRYAGELSRRAAERSVSAIINTIDGADDAIVIVINSGSGLVVATLDSLADSVKERTAKIN